MGRIAILPEILVNKIAAGEVVERPASVVKELMENALDAGASRIQLDVEQGGSKLIRVTDDGVGMSTEDLALSIQPHATSKIQREEDLFAVATMGFRGEALPSIGSVSHLSITSRPEQEIEGHRVEVRGGAVSEVMPVGCPTGTTVEVRDLFFNMPARRKFLKTVNTEYGYVTEQFSRIAIAHPHVHLTFTHNGREIHRLTAAETRLTRIRDLYGEELAATLLPVERQENGLTIDGYVIRPADSRATTRWQYSFVNGRYVRDRFVLHAVKEAYRGLIDANRQPGFFLFIGIAPDALDVNVHPTKIEVRWRDSGLIHSQFLSLLRETFLSHDLTPTARVEEGSPSDEAAEQRRSAIRQAMADFFKTQPPEQPSFDYRSSGEGGGAAHGGGVGVGRGPGSAIGQSGSSGWGASGTDSDRFEHSDRIGRPLVDGTAGGGAANRPGEGRAEVGEAVTLRPNTAGGEGGEQGPAGPRAIQLHNCYLVAETDDGIVIIDQHALHERVLYERFTARLNQGPLESQRLLIPETIPATDEQRAAAETHAELLKELGIEVGAFGPGVLAVYAFPVLLEKIEASGFVRDLLEKLAEAAHAPSRETLIHEVVDMMACKAAVKAGDPLNAEEIRALLASRDLVERASNCPHGRPTTLRMSLADLEKQFHRK